MTSFWGTHFGVLPITEVLSGFRGVFGGEIRPMLLEGLARAQRAGATRARGTPILGVPKSDMFGDPKIGVPNLGSQNRYPKIGVTNVTPIYQSHSIKGLGI